MSMEIELWIDIRHRLEQEEREYIESIRKTLPVFFISERLELPDETIDEKKQYSIDQKYIVYLGDDPQRIRQAEKQGCSVIAYLREDMPLGVAPYAVTSLLAIDKEYLTRVYCRNKGIPQVIAETDRLIIREMAMSDLDALLEIYDTNEKTAFFQPFYDNRDEAEAYLAAYIRDVYRFYDYGIWGIYLKTSGRMIGIVGYTPREGTGEKTVLELGYGISKKYQNCGYAGEACRAVLEYAEEKLDYTKIIEITKEGVKEKKEV